MKKYTLRKENRDAVILLILVIVVIVVGIMPSLARMMVADLRMQIASCLTLTPTLPTAPRCCVSDYSHGKCAAYISTAAWADVITRRRILQDYTD